MLREKAIEMLPKCERTKAQSWAQDSQMNNDIWNCITLQIIFDFYLKFLSGRIQDLLYFVIFLRRHIFAILTASCYLALVKTLKKSKIFYISHLFPTVQIIPILKLRDDGADMYFRNSSIARSSDHGLWNIL